MAWGAYDQNDTLRLSRSTNAGASFSEPVDIVRGEVGSLSFQELDVAAADDGQGFAVWESDESAAIAIRVASLEPAPPLPPPSVPPGPDTTNPTITNPSIGDSTLLPGQGTTFSFISSEGGSAKLVFQKRVKGLKLKKGTKLKCFVSSKKRLRKLRKLLAKQAAVKKLRGKARKRKLAKLVKKRGCKPFKTIGSITQVVTPGRNEIVFTGRVAGRKLAPGVYRATLTVRDLAGNLSSGRVFKFRVMKAR
ncbi:MAG: hypothetical protein H0U32_03735 [Thermoleophilaceae bacterium]|nr:hypothetical protein [Thermoleophilaceae bacterium]